MEEVRKHAHLDTQAEWDALTHIEQLERHARKCNYFGLGDNPARPVAVWSTCRRTTIGVREDLEGYKAFLQEVVGWPNWFVLDFFAVLSSFFFPGTVRLNRSVVASPAGTVSRMRFLVSPMTISVKNVSPADRPSGMLTRNTC